MRDLAKNASRTNARARAKEREREREREREKRETVSKKRALYVVAAMSRACAIAIISPSPSPLRSAATPSKRCEPQPVSADQQHARATVASDYRYRCLAYSVALSHASRDNDSPSRALPRFRRGTFLQRSPLRGRCFGASQRVYQVGDIAAERLPAFDET